MCRKHEANESVPSVQGTEATMAHHRQWMIVACTGIALSWLGSAQADTTPILIELSVDPALINEAALSQTISLELDCPVVSDREANHAGELTIKTLPRKQVSVTFKATDNQAPLVRIVALPDVPEQRAQWIAWLVGNLARNEAAEWLVNHQREKAEEASRQAEAQTEPGQAIATEVKSIDEKPSRPQAPLPVPIPVEGDEAQPNLTQHLVNLAVWHQRLELYPNSESLRFNLHLGLGYGRVGAIRGFGFDLIHHRNDVEAQGMVGAIGWTRVRRTNGLAWSVGVVTAEGELRGLDFAWLLAVRDANNARHQLGTEGSIRNVDIVGAQLGGLGAWSQGTMVGAQGAGLFAKHSGPLRGAQLSGIANVGEGVEGVQISAVNLAQDIRGVQLGIVNVARHVDGVAIGLVNISDNVRTQALAWAERNYHENLGIRYVYRPLTFGYCAGYDSANNRARFMLGVGARLGHGRFALAPSVEGGFTVDRGNQRKWTGRGHENDLRVSFEWELVPRLIGIMAGPALALRSEADGKLKFVPRWFVGLTLF
jgi:hypothetical protein